MYIALFLFVIFYDILEAIVPMGNYWDELATFLVLCWGACSLRKNPRMEKGELINWICLIVLVVIGLLGNLVHPGLQTSKAAIFKDIIALCKFPAIFFVMERRTASLEKREETLVKIAKISRWIVVLTLFAVVLGFFVDLGFYTNDVRILPSCTFIFSNPTYFISSYVMIAAVLMAESIRKNRVYLLIECLLLFLTQRVKGYAFIVFIVAFVLLGEKWVSRILTAIFGSDKEKIKPVRLVLAAAVLGLVFVVVGKPRLDRFLYLGIAAARVALYVVGIRILIDFFPLGSGFGTFASYLSGKHYSNIYEIYGISNVWGLQRHFYNFVSDAFWPYIYGQFGIFGMLIYLKLIISIFFRQFRSGLSDGSRIAVAAVWVYVLIASTSEAYFTNGTGVQMALFLTMFIGYGNKTKTAETEAALAETHT